MKLRSRVERLEKAARFTQWFQFSRFLEGLTDKELEEIAIHWRFPEPLPDPLPTGRSELDGLDRASLLRLWQESERETSRIMHEIRDRNEDERRFYLHHGHWPEQGCLKLQCGHRDGNDRTEQDDLDRGCSCGSLEFPNIQSNASLVANPFTLPRVHDWRRRWRNWSGAPATQAIKS